MTMKPCPRCQKLIPHGMAYCTGCRPIAEQIRQERREENRKRKQSAYNRSRNKTLAAFYRSKEWRTTSRAKLSSCGWKCEAHADSECTGLAVEVHHIKPIRTEEGWKLRLDWNNLEAVCTHCHNLRHPEKLRRGDNDVIDLRNM